MASSYASPSSVAFLGFRRWRRFPFLENHQRSGRTSAHPAAPWHVLRLSGRYGLGLAIISLITLFDQRWAGANATTAGFTFLIAILSASTLWGFGVSATMSVGATLAFDYFFLPPVGSLNIADPHDWIALSSFLITSMIGSHLSARARKQAREADRRRQEVERLYDLSQRLLHAESPAELCTAIPQGIVESFGVREAALFISSKQAFYRAGSDIGQLDDGLLRIGAGGDAVELDPGREACFVTLRSGKNVIGSLGISGRALSKETIDALGSLLAVSIERAGAIEHIAKMEAVREGGHLRSVVMDAITHDFRTPLTCIKASVTGLLADLEFDREQQKDLLLIIDEECDRIDQLVDKAAEMASLESGEIRLAPAPHSIGELISTALAECKSVFRGRPIQIEVRDKESRVLVDLPLARTVLGHLISNADLYSSPGQPITLSSEERDAFLFLSVADYGPGIDETEGALIFEKFYRGKDQRFRVNGTGMGLPIARAIVEAHGGTIGVVSRPGQGSVFTFSLPLA
ncbi:MAG TPA: ATP-binding protein [Candidatus Acidoferrum sp.]|nr:ATP-binding protein [Candidatus Acidoferrum sp.]